MSPPRFVVPGFDPASPALLPEQVHQVRQVLRLRPGDPLVVVPGDGTEWPAVLEAVSRDGVALRLGERRVPAVEAAREVWLAPALLKADKLDWVVQKATEIGVAGILPVVSQFAVARDLSATRLERLRRIAVEAVEQSGRVRVPVIAEPVPFAQAIARAGAVVLAPGGAGLLADGEEGPATLLVGPEGGWSPAELALAAEAGVPLAGIGPRVLRAETACVAAVSLVLLAGGV